MTNTISVETLIYELSRYNPDLPVYIQIGDGEILNISDVALSFNSDLSDEKITIEHWTKADDENEPGEII